MTDTFKLTTFILGIGFLFYFLGLVTGFTTSDSIRFRFLHDDFINYSPTIICISSTTPEIATSTLQLN